MMHATYLQVFRKKYYMRICIEREGTNDKANPIKCSQQVNLGKGICCSL